MPRIFSELLAELLVLQHEIADSHGHTVSSLQEEIRKLQSKDHGAHAAETRTSHGSPRKSSEKRSSASASLQFQNLRKKGSQNSSPAHSQKVAPASAPEVHKTQSERHSTSSIEKRHDMAIKHVLSADAARHVPSADVLRPVQAADPPKPFSQVVPNVPAQTPVLLMEEPMTEAAGAGAGEKASAANHSPLVQQNGQTSVNRNNSIDDLEDIPIDSPNGNSAELVQVPAAAQQQYSQEVHAFCGSQEVHPCEDNSGHAVFVNGPEDTPKPEPPTAQKHPDAPIHKSASLEVRSMDTDFLRRVSELSANPTPSMRSGNFGSKFSAQHNGSFSSYTPGDVHCGSMMAHGIDEASGVVPYPIWPRINQTMSPTKSCHSSKHVSTRMTIIEQLRKKAKSVDFHKIERSSSNLSKISRALVRHPVSPERLVWLSLGLILICLDIVVVPMDPFELPELEELGRVLAWIVTPYWTIDFVMSFLVGFQHRGTFEMRMRRTAWRYITSWMLIDLALVVIDWAAIIAEETAAKQSTSAARVTRSVRAMRALRSVRLARAVKLPILFKEASMLVSRSEITMILFTLTKHMFSIILINHVIACLWFGIGKETNGWVAVYLDLQSNGSWQNLYLTSLHWSLTQFTPATMSVQPQNVSERAFAVAVLLFALLTFSSFVSSITNMMTHLRSMRADEEKQFLKLEHYLHDKRISYYLSLRVRRYLEHYLVERKHGLEERDVRILGVLSEPLRLEIHYEVYSPWFRQHPFFSHYQAMNLPTMQKLCHNATSTTYLSMDDVLFSTGEVARSMSFCGAGRFQYAHTAPDGVESATSVSQGQWVCEIVLWAPWQHRGQLRSSAESSIISLDAEIFHNVVLGSQAALFETSCYAVEAVRTLNEFFDFQGISDITKIPFDPHQICIRAFKGLKQTKEGGFKWIKAITKTMGGDVQALPRKLSTENVIRDSWLSTASSTASSTDEDED